MTPSRRALSIILLLAGLSVIALSAAVLCGSSGCFSPAAQPDILWQLRLPRALSACAVGGLLALAGALMQVLLRNPLADPYVLGLSGGAAVGALGAMLAGLGALAVNLGAAAGALAAIMLVFALARRDFARQQVFGALDA